MPDHVPNQYPDGKVGDANAIPPAPEYPNEWQMGTPDLAVTLPKIFPMPADGPDLYQCFVVPLGLTAERFVRAIEFRPGNARVVHHALLFTDTAGSARRIGKGEPYSCFTVSKDGLTDRVAYRDQGAAEDVCNIGRGDVIGELRHC